MNLATQDIFNTYEICIRMDKNENEVRKVVEAWEKSIQDGDIEGILAQHTHEVVMFDVPEPLQNVGLEAYKKTWDVFFKYNSGGKDSFGLVDLKITASDTVAFCHALLKIGGPEPECRLTIGLKKIDGIWYIMHEHHSAPFALPDEN